MSYKNLTPSTLYRYRSEFGLDDTSAIIYHKRTKEPMFSCHEATIELIKSAGKLAPYSHLLKPLRAGI